ncbi:MAG: endonuclease III [Alphaproteobacteria bacterium]|nr:endonuclease III [Alphaproteobacteria bacterium]
MTPEQIEDFFARLEKSNPEPKIELNYYSTYTLLIATVLSAQSTDKGVNKATPALFKAADTPEKMIELGLDGLKEHIKTIGLYNNKAKNIIALSKELLEKHNGEVPNNRENLEKLSGVGRKTANVILNTAFGEPVFAVDTHVFRLGNRTGLALGKKPLDVEKELEKNVPDKYRLHAHHWLVLHGRYVCKAKKPDCKSCVVADLCEWSDKNL